MTVLTNSLFFTGSYSIEEPLIAAIVAVVFVVIVETFIIIGCGILFCSGRKKSAGDFNRGNRKSVNTTINECYAAGLDSSRNEIKFNTKINEFCGGLDPLNTSNDSELDYLNSGEYENEG